MIITVQPTWLHTQGQDLLKWRSPAYSRRHASLNKHGCSISTEGLSPCTWVHILYCSQLLRYADEVYTGNWDPNVFTACHWLIVKLWFLKLDMAGLIFSHAKSTVKKWRKNTKKIYVPWSAKLYNCVLWRQETQHNYSIIWWKEHKLLSILKKGDPNNSVVW